MNEFAQSLASVVWAMEPRALQRLIAQVSSVTQAQIDYTIRAIGEKGTLLDRLHARDGDGSVNVKRRDDDVDGKQLDVRDGVAHIKIAGPMMKQVPSIFNWLEIEATSTEAVRAELLAAVGSDDVKSIQLDIDSPGGTLDGTAALANDVYSIRGMKPITARVDDLMASAALWVGSQADVVSAAQTAAVGSIGVYAVVEDSSRMFEAKGITTHVVSSDDLKGAFVDGTRVTQPQIDDLQRNIDTYSELFIDAVARGRGVPYEDIDGIATGQVWIGNEAKEIGLVDLVDAGDVNATKQEPKTNVAPIASVQPKQEQIVMQPIAAVSAAHKETDMDKEAKKEMERLRAENAALKTKVEAEQAEAEQMRVKLEVAEATKRDALLSKYADRIPPATLASVTEIVRKFERRTCSVRRKVLDLRTPGRTVISRSQQVVRA